MTITLSDLTAATASYIDNEVDVRIADVTANLNPGEEGTYTVKVRNADEPTGVRLHDVTLHLQVSPASVALLKSPTGGFITARASQDRDEPALPRDELVDGMYVFVDGPVTDDTLEVGEKMELEFRYEAVDGGDATISCHVHATIDADDVFPRSAGANGSSTLTVRP